MAKVTVTFDFDNGDQDQFLTWMHGWRYLGAIQDLDNWLRSREKYEDDKQVKPSEVRDMLRESMDDLPIWG